jgi:hypothetical protein
MAADPVTAKTARRSASRSQNALRCLHQGALLPLPPVASDAGLPVMLARAVPAVGRISDRMSANICRGTGSARQAGPLDRALALFDELLTGAAVVVEGDGALRRTRQVGYDDADARIKLAGVPLDPRLREGRLLATTLRGLLHDPAR